MPWFTPYARPTGSSMQTSVGTNRRTYGTNIRSTIMVRTKHRKDTITKTNERTNGARTPRHPGRSDIILLHLLQSPTRPVTNSLAHSLGRSFVRSFVRQTTGTLPHSLTHQTSDQRSRSSLDRQSAVGRAGKRARSHPWCFAAGPTQWP